MVESSVEASLSPDGTTNDAGDASQTSDANDADDASDASDDADDASHTSDASGANDAGEASDAILDASAIDAGAVHASCNDACALGQQQCNLLPQVCTYDDAGFTVGCQPQVEGIWTCIVATTGCTVWGGASSCRAAIPCCLTCQQGTCPLGATGEPCEQDTDCASDACDALSHECASDPCADNRQDGTETDVDCGGNVCDACAGGKRCQSNWDCRAAEYCSSSHVCIGPILDAGDEPPPCQDECALGDQACSLLPQACTYDDAGFTASCVTPGEGTWTCVAGPLGCAVWAPGAACGAAGPCCSGCQQAMCDAGDGSSCWSCPPGADGNPCEQDTDCVSNACDAVSHACASSQCADHRVDGLETDVDCGGPSCNPCGLGGRCQSNRDCLPGIVCIDGGYWNVCR